MNIATAHAETLRGAMTKAFRNNPDLDVMRASIRIADEGVALAKSGYRPNIAIEGVVQASNTQGRSSTSANIGITLIQNIFDGFQTRNNVLAARSQVFAERENYLKSEIDILLATAQVYSNIIRDNQIVVFRRQNLEFLRQQLSAAKSKLDVGDGTQTDVSQAEAQLASAQAMYAAAKAQAEMSASVYVQIIGDAPRKLKSIRFPGGMLPKTVAAAVALGMNKHPAILSAQHSIDASSYQVKSNKGALLPRVNLKGSVNTQHKGITTAKIEARLTIPLYQGGASAANVRKSKELLGQQRVKADSIRLAVRQAIVASWAQRKSYIVAIRAIRTQLKAANMALSGVMEEHRVGRRTQLDVLLAQQSVLEAKEALAQSERNMVVASYSVLAATGQLTAKRLDISTAGFNPEAHLKRTENRWFGLDIND